MKWYSAVILTVQHDKYALQIAFFLTKHLAIFLKMPMDVTQSSYLLGSSSKIV